MDSLVTQLSLKLQQVICDMIEIIICDSLI